jgi:hypothetical protein
MAERKIIWSFEASVQVAKIKENILERWSAREVNYFLAQLKNFERLVAQYPHLYPKSLKNPSLRKAVISKHNSAIYEVGRNVIKVHTLLINKQAKN